MGQALVQCKEGGGGSEVYLYMDVWNAADPKNSNFFIVTHCIDGEYLTHENEVLAFNRDIGAMGHKEVRYQSHPSKMEWNLTIGASHLVTEEDLKEGQASLEALKSEIEQVPAEAFRRASRYVNPGERLPALAPMDLHSRAYFKLWEALVRFPLIHPYQDQLHTLHLCEAPGSFVQAVEVYWTTRCHRALSQWKWHGVTLPRALEWKAAPESVIYADLLRDTLPPECFQADLVTGDGGFDEHNEQEASNRPLLEAQFHHALSCCRVGGSIYIKMFDLFLPSTRATLQNIVHWFEESWIVKPFGSRICNSERFFLGLRKRLAPVTTEVSARLREVALGCIPTQMTAIRSALALARTSPPLDLNPYHSAKHLLKSIEIAAWLQIKRQ